MNREDFMRIFIDVSNKIISLGIDKGYFDPNGKQSDASNSNCRI